MSGQVFTTASDTFNAALYNGSGHDANTGAYTATNEVVGTGYNASGKALTGLAGPTVDTTNNVVYLDWDDVSWASSTITATDVMIYDDTVASPTANVSVYIGDFSGSKSSSSGAFTLTMPGAAFNTAIVRIA
jgi:hypothetical protein